MIDYDKKSPRRTARKVCAKCAKAGWYRPRETRCKRQKFGPGSYWCYGRLSAVTKPTAPLKHPAGYYITEEGMAEAQAERGAAVRKDAEKKLANARKQVDDCTRRMARLTTSLRMWQKRTAYYATRASVTDAEVEAERIARLSRPAKPRRRGIAIGGRL